MIRYLDRGEIDAEKWDDVIAHSTAETLYAYSWYLDASADNWSALVMDDYRFIMPLVWKRKYGIHYLYQPVFCQQLGVFSREFADPLLAEKFVGYMMKRFRFGVVNFNMKNMLGDKARREVYDRANYVLSLSESYEKIYKSYSVNAKRNLKRSLNTEQDVETDIGLDELMAFKKENDLVEKTDAQYTHMQGQFASVMENSKGVVYGLRDGDGLVAAAFMAFSKTRIIYLLSVSNARGKDQRAMFRIVDEVVRFYAGSDLSLDFEGSNIPSIARFFAGFGAKPEVYQSVSFNRLPVPFILGKQYGR
jgi:hypothetical protein